MFQINKKSVILMGMEKFFKTLQTGYSSQFFKNNTDILGYYSIYSNTNSQIQLKKLHCKNARENYKNYIYLLLFGKS